MDPYISKKLRLFFSGKLKADEVLQGPYVVFSEHDCTGEMKCLGDDAKLVYIIKMENTFGNKTPFTESIPSSNRAGVPCDDCKSQKEVEDEQSSEILLLCHSCVSIFLVLFLPSNVQVYMLRSF